MTFTLSSDNNIFNSSKATYGAVCGQEEVIILPSMTIDSFRTSAPVYYA